MSPGFSFLTHYVRLVLPSRGTSRAVSSSWWSLVAGGCRVLRFCSLASRRGVASFVCPAAWRCACPHPLPVVSFASRPFVSCVVSLLVPHVLRAAAVGRACSSHRVCSSRGAWLSVVLGRLAVIVRLISGCSSRVVWRGVVPVSLVVSSCRLVARLGERGGFCFSFYPGDCEWSEVLVSSSRGLAFVCLRCRRGMWRCRSHHRCSRLAHRRLFLAPGGIALASCRLPDLRRRDERRDDGCLLGYRRAAHHVSSMNVYNEYDVCDVYERYKDTRIRECDRYMS